MRTALALELRRARSLVLWLGLLAAGYAGFIVAFYPTVLENAASFEELLKLYPKELMAAFGLEGSLSDPGTFLNSYVYQFLWPLLAAIGAILLATRVAVDADRGFLDLPLSTPMSRTRYLGASIAGQALAIAALGLITVLAIEVVDLAIEPDFPVAGVALAGLHAILFAFAIAGVTTLLAVVTLSRGRAGGLTAAILLVMYLLNVVAALDPDLADLGRVSAFRYFDLAGVIDDERFPVADGLLFTAAAAGGWLAAILAFRRRDLVA